MNPVSLQTFDINKFILCLSYKFFRSFTNLVIKQKHVELFELRVIYGVDLFSMLSLTFHLTAREVCGMLRKIPHIKCVVKGNESKQTVHIRHQLCTVGVTQPKHNTTQ